MGLERYGVNWNAGPATSAGDVVVGVDFSENTRFLHVFWACRHATAPYRRAPMGAPGYSGRGHTHMHITTIGMGGSLGAYAAGGWRQKMKEYFYFVIYIYMASFFKWGGFRVPPPGYIFGGRGFFLEK